MNQELCRANIQANRLRIFRIVFFVLAGLSLALLIFSRIPFRTNKLNSVFGQQTFNWFNDVLYDEFGGGFTYGILETPSSLIFLICMVVFLILAVFVHLLNRAIDSCGIVLTESGVKGLKNSLFRSQSVELPFDKISSVSVRNGFSDKIFGGETVAIGSASGYICFSAVQNAGEFVKQTLNKIEEYKKSVQAQKNAAEQPAPAPVPAAADEADKLLKLKLLLEKGVISQEEYEEKRKELLAKL